MQVIRPRSERGAYFYEGGHTISRERKGERDERSHQSCLSVSIASEVVGTKEFLNQRRRCKS